VVVSKWAPKARNKRYESKLKDMSDVENTRAPETTGDVAVDGPSARALSISTTARAPSLVRPIRPPSD